MRRKSLVEQVDSWVRIAAVVASYARGDSGKGFLTPAEMSERLQLRWFSSHNTIKIAIEHNRDKLKEGRWLGSFSIGGLDPYLLSFSAAQITESDMIAIEEVARVTFPLIRLIRCHFCEGHLVYENKEGEWICLECLDLLPLKKASTFGYVYVFGSKEEGRYKIGQGANPRARMSDYRNRLPFPIEMIHTIPADDKVRAEADLHHRLKDKRESGEWFKLTPEELGQIMNLRGYNAGLWLTVI